MQKRILLTGHNSTAISDYFQRNKTDYHITKCSPFKDSLHTTLKTTHPHTILIGLKNETREDIQVFHLLKENPDYENIPIIIIGNEADCSLFNQIISQKTTHTLLRPFIATQFITLLENLTRYVDAPDYVENFKEQAPVKPEPEKVIQTHYWGKKSFSR